MLVKIVYKIKKYETIKNINKNMRLSLLFCLLLIPSYAQDLVKSGPMVGYSTMQEVLLWVQTSENAKVHFEYYEIDNPTIRLKTDEKITVKKTGFVAKLLADEVLPGKKYNMAVWEKEFCTHPSGSIHPFGLRQSYSCLPPKFF